MSTFKHTGVGDASARNQYAAVGQVQDSSFIWCGTAGGTKNALTLTPTPAITAYKAGQRFIFKSGSTASDDAVTVAISGLTTKAVQLNDAALSSSVVIDASKYYEILYDGTAFQISRLSSALSRTGVDGDVVTGTAGTDGNLAQWNSDGDIVDGPDVLDEDDMSSDSATAVPTQQSVKAYIDAAVAGALVLDTPQASTSGTSILFSGIPIGVKKITVMLSGVSTSGTSQMLLRIGDSGGVETTGYASAASNTADTVTSTAGFVVSDGSVTVAAASYSGAVTLTLLNASTNVWAAQGCIIREGTNCGSIGGVKALSATLDRVSITTAGGSDTFDAGEINIQYE